MKIINIITMCILLLFVEVKGQITSISEDISTESTVSGIFPISSTMLRGGKEKTAIGTLKVLVIFVRYLDDTQNTSNWPNYNVLPSWAQTFVEPGIPPNNIFTPLNLSDFFDRLSGGNGSGTLGQFHFIGDVVYVTTLHNENYYSYDTQVFTEVLQTLDDPTGSYNINFKQYDNWQFMSGDTLFNHNYKPGVGDGLVDHIWIINRGASKAGVGAEKTLEGTYFVTNDNSVIINRFSGSRIFGAKNTITPQAVGGPAHEYVHYLFGGNQTEGHFDGYDGYSNNHNNYSNRGRINLFALMIASNAGYMSGYEKYRLGWLNPTIITSNTNSLILGDTHIKNQAVIIPLRYDVATGWLKEYYFIENYVTKNEYPGANPFLVSAIFYPQHILTHGLLVYHIKNEDFYTATNSDLKIMTADGRWSWQLVQGAATPYDRSDDVIDKDINLNHTGFTHREYITINVGATSYGDYVCLKPRSDFPGARYTSDDFLGTERDFFKIDYNNLFSKYSNPATYLGDDVTEANVGFQILNFNTQTKDYTLSIQIDYNGVISLSPAKPQNLKLSIVNSHPFLTWKKNLEPDLDGYYIYRTENTNPVEQIAYIPKNAWRQGYTDTEVSTNVQPDNISYTIKAKDTSSLLSINSDNVSVMGILMKPNPETELKILQNNYSLNQNYPNPFNPSTEIKYTLKRDGFVTIKVYDVLGRVVATLVNENKPSGFYTVNFNASKLSSGVYFYRLITKDFIQTKKMMYLR